MDLSFDWQSEWLVWYGVVVIKPVPPLFVEFTKSRIICWWGASGAKVVGT